MNLTHYLETSAQKVPDKIAVRFGDQTVTYKELNIRCNRLAAGLKKMGLAARDCCALMVPNSIDTMVAYYALAKLGAVIVPINYLYKEHELRYIFSDSKPKANERNRTVIIF
jgi:acyl-CoA synthetase (AMP-forming)/AMP-acid ligase II